MVNECFFWWGIEVIGKVFREIDLFIGEDKVVIYGVGDFLILLGIIFFRLIWWF